MLRVLLLRTTIHTRFTIAATVTLIMTITVLICVLILLLSSDIVEGWSASAISPTMSTLMVSHGTVLLTVLRIGRTVAATVLTIRITGILMGTLLHMTGRLALMSCSCRIRGVATTSKILGAIASWTS